MEQIPRNNLYGNGRIIQFNDGEQIIIRDLITSDKFEDFEYHTVMQNDEITNIAYKYYKGVANDASKYWWVIADVNNIMRPHDISDLLGQDLIIPNLRQLNNARRS